MPRWRLIRSPTRPRFTVTWNLPIGNHVIKARYPGNPNFLAVNTAGYSLVITAH